MDRLTSHSLMFASFHAGVAVLMSPDIPLQLGLDSRQQFCLQSLPSMERLPLQYTVCVAHNVKAAHQEAVQQLSQHSRELPNMRTLWSVILRFRLVEIRIMCCQSRNSGKGRGLCCPTKSKGGVNGVQYAPAVSQWVFWVS